jgi:hypothetical protein
MSITYVNKILQIGQFIIGPVAFAEVSKKKHYGAGVHMESFEFELLVLPQKEPYPFYVVFENGHLDVTSKSFPWKSKLSFTKGDHCTDEEYDNNLKLFKKLYLIASSQSFSTKFQERVREEIAYDAYLVRKAAREKKIMRDDAAASSK